MQVRAVVADLDGTLVRRDFSVSEATVGAMDLLDDAGIPLVIATARTPPGVEHLQPLANHVAIAACCSGAMGWSRSESSTLWIELFGPETVKGVIEIATSFGAGVASFDGQIWRMTDEYERLSPGQPHGPQRLAVAVSELIRFPSCAMAIRRSAGDLAEIRDLLVGTRDGARDSARERDWDVAAASSHVGGATVLDVMPLGVDKGTGAVRALGELGIAASDSISFGDMPNDLPLFAVTARGYSVGRSDATVVASADEVLDDVEHDGFSRKIVELAECGWMVVD